MPMSHDQVKGMSTPVPRLWFLNTVSVERTQGLLKAITDPSTVAGSLHGEPGNSCYMRSKNIFKDYWDLVKELKSQR